MEEMFNQMLQQMKELTEQVIMTEVELVMSHSSVVQSIFSPASFFCSMPNSSMNAPRVPLPSSREMTLISSASAKAEVIISTIVIIAQRNFFTIHTFFHSPFVPWDNEMIALSGMNQILEL